MCLPVKVEIISTSNNWKEIMNAARNTVGKRDLSKEPSEEFKRKILLAEHSPIRLLQIHWRFINLPYWVSVHFSRHKHGIEHFVTTQRGDRIGNDRDKKNQGSPVTHEIVANAQAIINISRKRLCLQASLETRTAWKAFLELLNNYEPALVDVCTPECIYRGFCPEIFPCGAYDSEYFDYDKFTYDSIKPKGGDLDG